MRYSSSQYIDSRVDIITLRIELIARPAASNNHLFMRNKTLWGKAAVP